MGVYLCLGQSVHTLNHGDSIPISITSYHDIHQHMSEVGKLFLFMGESINKKQNKLLVMRQFNHLKVFKYHLLNKVHKNQINE